MMDTEEQEAINELKAMSREELDNVDYTLKKWICGCKNCNNGTRVRDYGISPEYYWPVKGKDEWVDLTRNYLMCGKHNKFMKKLEKLYGREKVEEKMIDFSKMCLQDIKLTKSNKLNE